ncbi:LEM3/CDC50 family protein [Cordyceps militaris CM01]|uniref:LEM3/CDC50 family protein n=1 Tax=Cordyceps militaris (strain CM01) TaxID=983644 RepID=G3JNP5_CORMM|nr:LEM3/CDC50 family protein [Cordyceps militaris CM01]EGX89885.1 LEM3/CDC50 family protein [Cordyceps militaris CM01]
MKVENSHTFGKGKIWASKAPRCRSLLPPRLHSPLEHELGDTPLIANRHSIPSQIDDAHLSPTPAPPPTSSDLPTMSDTPRDVGQDDHRDSNDSNPPSNGPEKKKSRRPATIKSMATVLPLFFAIGIIFAPIGGLLLYANSLVQEIKIDYTKCIAEAKDAFGDMPTKYLDVTFKNGSINDVHPQWRKETGVAVNLSTSVTVSTDICRLRFSIPADMKPPVLFYYHLTNFYQNHRRYVDSFDAAQLNGAARSYSEIDSSKCTPLKVNTTSNKPIFPCGLIANSMFNDTFSSPTLLNPPGSNTPRLYDMNNSTNIAWASDKDLYSTTKYTYEEAVPPPNWLARYPNGYTAEDPPPNLKNWEAFQVWMRTAALPDFSKLYQRNDADPMEKGTYEIAIHDYFKVSEFGGTKSVLITTRTVMGGRNPFLGIAYIVVGGVCIILGGIFTVTHLIKPRKLGDHTYLSWNNTPTAKSGGSGGTAVASGREVRPGEA